MSDAVAAPGIWFAYFKQAGEGCDYTIGCAQTLRRLNATNAEAAKEEALAAYPLADSETAVDRILLLRVVEELDLAAEIADGRTKAHDRARLRAIAEKKAEVRRAQEELRALESR